MPTDSSSGQRGGPDVAGSLRHAPVQERGRRRVQQLLDAAAEVIAASGVDNATTNAIAARAGTSVGVLYKFFPNKQAIVEALALRYIGEIEQFLSRQEQAGIAGWPLEEAIDWIVRAIMEFHRTHPAYQHVYRAVRGASGERGVLLLDQARRVIGHLLALRMPAVPAERLEWHAITAVEAAHALVVQASILPPERGEKLIEETVILLTRYLSPDYAPRTDAS